MNWNLRALQIKDKITIFHALEFINVSLRSGHHTQQIICPFHDDTKPSARVYEDTGKLYCFKCQKLWDSLDLVQKAHSCDLYQAIERLEKAFGIDPTKINLTLALKHNLTKDQDQKPSPFYLYSYVESQLIESRFQMGLTKYCKALTALDHMHYYLTSGRITPEAFRVAATKILTFIGGDSGGTNL